MGWCFAALSVAFRLELVFGVGFGRLAGATPIAFAFIIVRVREKCHKSAKQASSALRVYRVRVYVAGKSGRSGFEAYPNLRFETVTQTFGHP